MALNESRIAEVREGAAQLNAEIERVEAQLRRSPLGVGVWIHVQTEGGKVDFGFARGPNGGAYTFLVRTGPTDPVPWREAALKLRVELACVLDQLVDEINAKAEEMGARVKAATDAAKAVEAEREP